MKVLLGTFCLIAIAATAIAQVEDLPAPTPVPFTPEPRELQWRIGFDLGNTTVLETPELNPEKDTNRAVREAERVLVEPLLSWGLGMLPYAKVTVANAQLVNPREWTILDLQNKAIRKSFQILGVFMGTRMTTTEGGYHLVSLPAVPRDPFLGVRKEPSPETLVFGFAGRTKGRLQLRTRLSETKWENLLPVEDPADLPAGYEQAKQLLEDGKSETQRYLYGTAIEATVRNRLSKIWLLNYSHPDTTKGTHPWGIFIEEGSGLQPLYIYKPDASSDPYVAYLTASLDLNQDGSDELIVEASYRIGTAFKVLSLSGSNYREILTSYYRGPS
ncbi:MAG TPA: hypothetical protein VKY31_11925 [Terriglobia bacterium]|nr:hypothetical protein [Terriglobia bacterium]